jgi:hypothetical protein
MDGFTLKLAYLTNFGLGTMSKVAASWPSDESKDASAIADAHCYMAHVRYLLPSFILLCGNRTEQGGI